MLTATATHVAGGVVVDGVVYTYKNGIYIVTGWDETYPLQSLHILGELDDGYVEGIGRGAFQDNEDIRYLIIDEGITYIDESAFSGCTGLEFVVLPEGLETIGEEAFYHCMSLTELVVPSTVRNIQARAFMECTGVTDVYFLMTTEQELTEFVWWDGWYRDIEGEYDINDPHGGIEFRKSRKPYDGDDDRIEHDPVGGTHVRIPAGTAEVYDNSSKFEAWLLEEVPVDRPTPLWWIVNYGKVGSEYTVADDLMGIYIAGEQPTQVYAKDLNQHRTPSVKRVGEVDYVRQWTKLQSDAWDQSNWVLLDFGDTRQAEAEAFAGKKGDDFEQTAARVIKGGTLRARLDDKLNPTMTVIARVAPTEAGAYVENQYVPCNFMKPNVQVSTADGYEGTPFFFVVPKAQEFVRVNWATYQGDGYFTLPPEPGNSAKLVGDFKVCWDLYPGIPEEDFEEGCAYNFHAIVRYDQPEPSSPSRNGGDVSQGPFTVYPLEGGQGVITAVHDIGADRQVTGVTYVNPMGMMRSRPFGGLNIVVTRYSDGTTRARLAAEAN